MYSNILLTVTNLVAIYPLVVSYNVDIVAFILILSVSIASVVSHAIAKHHHNLVPLPALDFDPYYSVLTNDIDRVLCAPVALYMYAYYAPPSLALPVPLVLIATNVLSSKVKDKLVYTLVHSIWHVGIYWYMGYLLQS